MIFFCVSDKREYKKKSSARIQFKDVAQMKRILSFVIYVFFFFLFYAQAAKNTVEIHLRC